MTKQFKLAASVIESVKAGDTKVTNKVISDTKTAYGKLSHRLHVTAAIAAFAASQFGNAVPLNNMFQWLKKNDATALATWLGENTAFNITDSEGNEQSISWLVSKKDDGKFVVSVKKNTKKIKFSEVREAITLEDWFGKDNFADRDNVQDHKDAQEYNLMAVIKKELAKADKIASGDSDKFYMGDDQQSAMLNRVLHAATKDTKVLSGLYAAVNKTEAPAE